MLVSQWRLMLCWTPSALSIRKIKLRLPQLPKVLKLIQRSLIPKLKPRHRPRAKLQLRDSLRTWQHMSLLCPWQQQASSQWWFVLTNVLRPYLSKVLSASIKWLSYREISPCIFKCRDSIRPVTNLSCTTIKAWPRKTCTTLWMCLKSTSLRTNQRPLSRNCQVSCLEASSLVYSPIRLTRQVLANGKSRSQQPHSSPTSRWHACCTSSRQSSSLTSRSITAARRWLSLTVWTPTKH